MAIINHQWRNGRRGRSCPAARATQAPPPQSATTMATFPAHLDRRHNHPRRDSRPGDPPQTCAPLLNIPLPQEKMDVPFSLPEGARRRALRTSRARGEGVRARKEKAAEKKEGSGADRRTGPRRSRLAPSRRLRRNRPYARPGGRGPGRGFQRYLFIDERTLAPGVFFPRFPATTPGGEKKECVNITYVPYSAGAPSPLSNGMPFNPFISLHPFLFMEYPKINDIPEIPP